MRRLRGEPNGRRGPSQGNGDVDNVFESREEEKVRSSKLWSEAGAAVGRIGAGERDGVGR